MKEGYYVIEDSEGYMLIHSDDLKGVDKEKYTILAFFNTNDFDTARDLYYKWLDSI